jgi:hypothetical protein
MVQEIMRRLAPDFPAFHHYYSYTKFQDILYRLGKEKIYHHLKHTRFYGVAFDTYTTHNKRPVLGCTLRFYRDNGDLDEIYMGCVEIDSRGDRAEVSLQHIKDLLKRFGVEYHDMISAAFDGAAVNLGAMNSIAALLARDIPHIHIVHCAAHAFVFLLCV